MQKVWFAVVSLVLGTAACVAGEPAPVEATETDESSARIEGELGYGWSTKLRDRTIGRYSLSQIVTDRTVRIRGDGRPCVACHSWAEYQDRASFCKRVDAFLGMPTAKGDGTSPPNAKPAALKNLLRDWRDADCPD